MTVLDGRMPELLRGPQPLLGIFISIPSPALVEMTGHAGFDFVVIDNEHGPAGIETTEHLIRAARCAGVVPIVRVSGANQQEILRTLDVGASGVQVPQVNTLEQARLVAGAAKYPPAGSRGVAFGTRAAGYGFFGGAAYVAAANEQTVVVTHPAVQATITDCIRRIAAAGRAPGLMVTTTAEFGQWADAGARYITINMASVVGSALKAAVAAAR
jgi:4-hydroxy-2-oxoheptanedioate aldolase